MTRKTQPWTARLVAAKVLTQVIKERKFLDICLNHTLPRLADPRERSLAQNLCYGVLRWLPRLQSVLAHLMVKPMRRRDLDVNCLLLLGLYQIEHTRIPNRAAVAESVSATRALGKPWASGLVNATLRKFLDHHGEICREVENQAEFRFSHPNWLINAIRKAWPEDWAITLCENNR